MKCNNCPCKDIDKECIYENTPYVCQLIESGRSDFAEVALKECVSGNGLGKIVHEPGVIQKTINFTGALLNHLLTGMQKVTPTTQNERIKICEGCVEYFDESKRICKHVKCGCPIDKKTLWASESCPINKWSSIDILGSGCGCASK